MKHIALIVLLLLVTPTLAGKYVDELKAKYGKNIIFADKQAKRIVLGFVIDCNSETRVLPLINMLYARVDAIESSGNGSKFISIAESRGREVRIYDHMKTSDGQEMEKLAFEINQWGELIPHGISTAPILNACAGSQGPIWKKIGK